MAPIRQTILNLEPNGIGRVAFAGLGQRDVIPLWFGETDLVTPGFIRDAAKQALDDGHTFYDQARGKTALREAIKAFHKRMVGVDVDIERISLPGAATLAVVTAMQCLIENGDNAVIVSPIWPSIFQAAQVVGAELRFARLEEDWTASPPRWRLDLDKLFALCDARTKVIFVCSPGNPTGWMATRAEQKAILEFARKRHIAIISDEVYGTLVYDGSEHAPSLLQIADPEDNLFVINSFSKAWAMTGWRIGWLVHPKSLAPQIDVMSIANNTGPTTFAAIRRARRAVLRRRRLPRHDAGTLPSPGARSCRISSTVRTASVGLNPKAPFTVSSIWKVCTDSVWLRTRPRAHTACRCGTGLCVRSRKTQPAIAICESVLRKIRSG